MLCKLGLLLTALVLAISSLSAYAQQPMTPLSLGDVEELLKAGVTPRRVAGLVGERGVNFPLNGTAIERLNKAGADTNVLAAVGKAADKFASTKAPVVPKQPEPAKPKLPEARNPAEPKVVTRPAIPPSAPLPTPSQGQASRDGAEMVTVPASEFWMGAEDSDALANERPRRRIYLDAFLIDKYEVTNALYQRFLHATGRTPPQYWKDRQWNESNPVVGVDWQAASAYCNWAGKRLPTEAEWEKAARGTDGRKYPWGEQWDNSRTNSNESGFGKAIAVGSYPAGVSVYGTHDMAGNVWEWIADWYGANYYYENGARPNPKGPDSGPRRGVRGGSWNNHPRNLRTTYRTNNDVSGPTIGFRCAQ